MENLNNLELMEMACKLQFEIKEKERQLKEAKKELMKRMEKECVSELTCPYGTVKYMSYDKAILNKDKTSKAVQDINAGGKHSLSMDDFTKTVGVKFPMIKMNDIQKESIMRDMYKNGELV